MSVLKQKKIPDIESHKYKVLIVESSKTIMAMLFNNLNGLKNIYPLSAMNITDCCKILDSYAEEILLAVVDYGLHDAQNGKAIDIVQSYHIPVIALVGDLDKTIHDYMHQKQVLDYVSKRQPNEIEYITHLVQRFYSNREIKLLIVDDSASVRKQLQKLLIRYQYQVFLAEDGIEALKVLDENKDILLIITDYNMPNMNGDQLTQTIRKSYRREDLAIIAISDPSKKGLSITLLKSGANDFISKPFEIEEFYCRVTQMTDMMSYIRKIKLTATTDELTGLHNRRYFFDIGGKLYDNAKRQHIHIAAAMIDADFFKKVNDNYGHETGDEVLRALAKSLKESFRTSDVIARYGGEEFICLITTQNRQTAKNVLEKVRKNIENLSVDACGSCVKFTVSIGVTLSLDISLTRMLNAADQALYAAKRNGRNQVFFYEDLPAIKEFN